MLAGSDLQRPGVTDTPHPTFLCLATDATAQFKILHKIWG